MKKGSLRKYRECKEFEHSRLGSTESVHERYWRGDLLQPAHGKTAAVFESQKKNPSFSACNMINEYMYLLFR